MSSILQVRKYINPNLKVGGILLTMVDGRTNLAKDIIYNKYTNETIYSIIPKLCKKYMKTHNDSVEHTAIIMLLEDELYDKGYILRDTDLNKLDVLK